MKSKSFASVRFTLSLGTFVIMMLFCGSVFGQGQGTSAIRGSIKDPQGSVVAGATVTLTNPETNLTRTTTSNDNGQFAFEAIQPGVYKVEVEAQNFKKAVFTEVGALVSKPTDLPVTMEIGNVSETVSVTVGAGEALINTQDGSLGNNFVSQQITQLPLNARNVANLLSLQPAVTPDGYVAGGRSDQANITLDGVDINKQQTGDAFSPVLRVSPDTVEEFRVTTTNPNASQGRSSGAQVELITKQGNNDWHGNLFEYHRNTIFTANDFFNNSTIDPDTGKSIPRPTLLRNNFGGSLGGPVMKDRFFFFYNYEGRRDARQGTVNRTVPLASLGQGLLRFNARTPGPNGVLVPVTLTTAQLNNLTTGFNNGTQTPTGNALVNVNPVTVGILAGGAARYPANNFRLGDGLNTGGFQFNAPLPVKLSAHVARLDFNITKDARHIGYIRGNYQQDVTGAAPQFPDTPPTNTWSHPLGFVGGHTWTISNNKVNNFRYGYTREAFTDQGDSSDNAITFRNVFSSHLFARGFSRTTPTQNITDDFSWIKGNHTLGFGTNVRIIRNNRENFAAAFDNGITNQSFYAGSGNVVTNPINAWLPNLTGLPVGTTISTGTLVSTRHAFAALLGRLSQYTANFNFDVDGTPLDAGEPVLRSFATEEYDVYAQDIWKFRDNVTFTLGLRYGLSRPVYERNGFQTRPSVGLQEYLDRRFEAASRGENFNEPLTVVLAGPAHDAPGFYSLDKNNFQPRAAIAWSPAFRSGFLAKLFGSEKQSTFRGGFSITNDYFGQALAVNFDGNNTLGFSSNTTPSANTYNVTTNPAPLITGLGQPIRNLPGITVPADLVFPQTQPQDFERRIEGSLDTNLVSPINYNWNFTYGRQFGKGLYVETSYIGRIARNLLATRDVMQLNNIVDPKSGQDWYTAARILEQHRINGTPVANISNLPWFENLYPAGEIDDIFFGLGLSNTQAAYAVMAGARTPDCDAIGCGDFGDDWTFLQDLLDQNSSRQLFFQSQYGALSAYGTIASSDYHGATLSVRQRLRGLSWDFNYTFSKSIDDASGLQTSGVFGAAFITNALRQRDNRAVSNFDLTHIVNANAIWDVPIGRGRQFLSGSNKFVNAVLGGWTITSIFRYNSGPPVGSPVDIGGWPTNWNARSWSVPLGPIQSSPNRGGNGRPANLFADPEAAYNSFRSPAPGETGARNILRGMGFSTLDTGLSKSFGMPWSENHKLTIRWETFNVTNTQYLEGNADNTNGVDPQFGSPGPTFYNFTRIQGNPRIMQFALRYDF
jgi:Carboxypeptidase regulatory-like domain